MIYDLGSSGTFLTLDSAAKRVDRDVRTIKRWLADPGWLPSYRLNGSKRVWVRLDELLAALRRANRENPSKASVESKLFGVSD